MKILLMDPNTSYSEKFCYFMQKKYPEVQVISAASFDEISEKTENFRPDVVLMDASLDTADTERLFSGDPAFAYISATHEIVNGTDTIFKYRGISVLYGQICGFYEKKKKRVVLKAQDTEETEQSPVTVITFLPVHGGAGASSMAAAVSELLGAEAPVLYINLEQTPSDAVFFEGDNKKCISDIVSHLNSKYTEASLIAVLKTVIRQDRRQRYARISYIAGYRNIMDVGALTAGGLSVLLQVLKNKLEYRYIVIDADFTVGPILKALLADSDKMVLVSAGSDISDKKINGVRRYLEVLGRDPDIKMPQGYLILNQYYGTGAEQESFPDMPILGEFARYRTNDKTRISSQMILDEVLKKPSVADLLR